MYPERAGAVAIPGPRAGRRGRCSAGDVGAGALSELPLEAFGSEGRERPDRLLAVNHSRTTASRASPFRSQSFPPWTYMRPSLSIISFTPSFRDLRLKAMRSLRRRRLRYSGYAELSAARGAAASRRPRPLRGSGIDREVVKFSGYRRPATTSCQVISPGP
jgi:hypothetical protein